MDIHFIGVLAGLAVGIFLIVRKLNPVAALFIGTVVGAIVGGVNIQESLRYIISGSASVMGINARVIASGVLAGMLIESGAAETIARTIVKKLGVSRVLMALTLAAAIITASGIFITVCIVMMAPIALSVAKQARVSKMAVLLAVCCGAKSGNIISPNPNAVTVSEAFGVPLGQVMIGGIVPLLFGIVLTVILARFLRNKGSNVTEEDVSEGDEQTKFLPSFSKAIVGPVVAISLLLLGPVSNLMGIGFLRNFHLDAFFVLPIAAITGALVMGKGRNIISYANSGILRMLPIVMILIGAGALGGIITGSNLPEMVIAGIDKMGLPDMLLAPLSSTLMAAAAASTATGTLLACASFGETILALGIAPLSAAVMMHAGAMFIDVMPHGNIFLASKESFKISMKERLKLMPYEIAIGAVMVISATILFGLIFT
jgi:GntP family gluconate:H+ symporter